MSEGFGALLRTARQHAGWSQQELAERAGLTVNAVSQLERGVRTRPYPHTVRALGDALQLDDAARSQLVRAVPSRSSGPTAAATSTHPAGRLPAPPTDLVGREADIQAVLRHLGHLGRARLVTLTGPGGVGKTALALAVAARIEDRPVVFASLAATIDANAALRAIAQAVGLHDLGADVQEQLLVALGDRNLLLVLDNLEQVVGLGPPIAELLSAAPAVTILATSRAALHIRAEQVHPVEPLPIPHADADVDGSAVDLLVARARAHDPRFAARPEHAAHDESDVLAAICRRLDGLPLAIELVASWLALLSPRALLERLHDSTLELDGGPADLPARQRTMRATIAWSDDLLEPEQQVLLRTLAVLPSTWDLEMAAVVTDRPEADVLRGVAVLVERNLVQGVGPDARGRIRFRMLETIRSFALEPSATTADLPAARDRHAAYVEEVCVRAADALDGPEQAHWLDHMQTLLDDVRAALRWRLEAGDVDPAGRIYGELRWLWYLRHCGEGLTWGERILGRPDALSAGVRSRARATSALLRMAVGDLDGARDDALSAEANGRTAGDADGLCLALTVRANTAAGRGDLKEAALVAEDAHARAAAIAHPSRRALTRASATLAAARAAMLIGDLPRTELLLEQADADLVLAGQPWTRAYWLNVATAVDQAQGRIDEVWPRLRRTFELCLELDDTPALLYALVSLATQLLASGALEDAARVLGAADALVERSGQQMTDQLTRLRVADERQMITERLGAEAVAIAAADGASRTIPELVETFLPR